MSAICIVDTSVFCEILAVPNLDADRAQLMEALTLKIEGRETLLLPLTTLIETGNHIGQNGDGTLRRRAAALFATTVRSALSGEAPFTLTRFFDAGTLEDLLSRFPDWVGSGSGFGDLTIQDEWHRQCLASHRSRRVYIWSKDQHLASYDRQGE